MKFNKKIFACILLSALILTAVPMFSFAKGYELVVSKDLTSASVNGFDFFYVPPQYANYIYFETDIYKFDDLIWNMTKEQNQAVDYYTTEEFYTNDGSLYAFELRIEYTETSKSKTVTYINTHYQNEYQKLISFNSNKASAEVYHLADYDEIITEISCEFDILKSGKTVMFDSFVMDMFETNCVYGYSDSELYCTTYGVWFYDEYIEESENSDYFGESDNFTKVFYYLDYKENNLPVGHIFKASVGDQYTVHIIKDAQIVAALDEVLTADEIDMDAEEYRIGATVIAIFFSMLLIGGAIALIVVFFIKASNASKPFDFLYRAIAISSIVLTVLIIILTIFYFL